MDGHGIVTQITGDKARVTVLSAPAGGCAGCAAHGHCSAPGQKPREITVTNDYGASVSDLVTFEADSGKVILSAALVWLLPLAAMIAGYLAGERFGGGFIPVGAAMLAFAASFLILRLIDRTVAGGKTFYPRITGVLDPDSLPPCEHEAGNT